MPWSHAVLRALEVHAYRRLRRHQPGAIAAQIGVDRETEETCLAALGRAGQIRKVRGKWRVRDVLSIDTRADPDGNLKLKQHWADVAANRLRSGAVSPDALYSYNLFAISAAGAARIRTLHMNYFESLRAIVAECEDPDRVMLANVQLCPLMWPLTDGA
jgi:hypothetical protein